MWVYINSFSLCMIRSSNCMYSFDTQLHTMPLDVGQMLEILEWYDEIENTELD